MSGERRRHRGVYLLPNLLTTGNLFSGFYAVIAVFNERYLLAAVAILIALVFDMLDGQIARFTKTSSRFGVEYDSLADLISFGLAPGLLIYAWALSDYGRLGWAAAFLFLACGALRLARFNVQAGGTDTRFFTGLPIPAAASLIATTVLLDEYIVSLGREVRPIVILLMMYTLAFLMVSRLRYRAFKEFSLHRKRPFESLALSVLGLIILVLAPQVVLFAVFALYALSGIVERPCRAAIRRLRRVPPPPPSISESGGMGLRS